MNSDGDVIYDTFVRPQEDVVGAQTFDHAVLRFRIKCRRVVRKQTFKVIVPLFWRVARGADYRTKYSGVREEDVANAPTFAEVQKRVNCEKTKKKRAITTCLN